MAHTDYLANALGVEDGPCGKMLSYAMRAAPDAFLQFAQNDPEYIAKFDDEGAAASSFPTHEDNLEDWINDNITEEIAEKIMEYLDQNYDYPQE